MIELDQTYDIVRCKACYEKVMVPLSIEGDWRWAIDTDIVNVAEGPCYIVFETDEGIRYRFIREGEPVPKEIEYTDDASDLDGTLFTTNEFSVHELHSCAPENSFTRPLVRETRAVTKRSQFN